MSTRIVMVEAAQVLEMVDPNDNTRARHQYVVAGGVIWKRRLPADSDEWADIGAPRWELLPAGRVRGPIDDYADQVSSRDVLVVSREKVYDGSGGRLYVIRGETVDADDADDVALLAGPILGSMWTVPLPPCADCGGDLVWWEAGYVPGTRRCCGQPVDHDAERRPIYDRAGGCGSLYTLTAASSGPVEDGKGAASVIPRGPLPDGAALSRDGDE